MSINKRLCYLVIFVLLFLMLVNGVLAVSASDNNDIQVTATTSASITQGNSGYCYVYIDSLEAISSLSVTVHWDSEKIKVDSSNVYNSVSCILNDKALGESSVQFSYIFDGNGEATKKQLFYFRYTVLSDAKAGDSYFDIVVNEAYDSSLNDISVSGSRCAFKITEKVTSKTCSIYSSSSVSTSVGEEFEISYRLSTYQIASGSFVINYDSEMFEVVSVTSGAFCDNKIVDVNTSLTGAVYISFVGTEYNSSTSLISIKFKTIKNVEKQSVVKMTVTEFYDLDLIPISCSGYTTTAKVIFDETYTEDAPNMSLQAEYEEETDKLTLTVKLDKDSMLGAGDFVIAFDANYLTYNSVQKGFSPTFFNINDKDVANGILKFSIISFTNIMDELTVLTVVFDVKNDCEDMLVDFEINGSGLTDALTNAIILNFIDTNITISPKHTALTYQSTSLLLDGSIGVKMYFDCEEDIIDTDKAVLNAILKNSVDSSETAYEFPLAFDAHTKTLYTVIYLPPKDIDNITISSLITVNTLDGDIITITDIPDVAVTDYIDTLKGLAETDEECAKALDLVNSLETYCLYTDKYFNENVTNVEEIELDESEEDDIKEHFSPSIDSKGKLEEITFDSTSLILREDVTIRHYFKVNTDINISDYTVEGGTSLKFSDDKKDYVYTDIENIPAHQLGDKKTVTISYKDNDMSIVFSPIDYVGLTYNSDNAKLRNLSKTLYRYYCEAKKYKENI